jgi:hypothetical protein
VRRRQWHGVQNVLHGCFPITPIKMWWPRLTNTRLRCAHHCSRSGRSKRETLIMCNSRTALGCIRGSYLECTIIWENHIPNHIVETNAIIMDLPMSCGVHAVPRAKLFHWCEATIVNACANATAVRMMRYGQWSRMDVRRVSVRSSQWSRMDVRRV